MDKFFLFKSDGLMKISQEITITFAIVILAKDMFLFYKKIFDKNRKCRICFLSQIK